MRSALGVRPITLSLSTAEKHLLQPPRPFVRFEERRPRGGTLDLPVLGPVLQSFDFLPKRLIRASRAGRYRFGRNRALIRSRRPLTVFSAGTTNSAVVFTDPNDDLDRLDRLPCPGLLLLCLLGLLDHPRDLAARGVVRRDERRPRVTGKLELPALLPRRIDTDGQIFERPARVPKLGRKEHGHFVLFCNVGRPRLGNSLRKRNEVDEA